MGEPIEKGSKAFYGFCMGLGAFVATMAAIMFFSLNDNLFSVRGIILPNEWLTQLGKDDQKFITDMMRAGEIITPQQLLGGINTLYSNIIQFLIALVGIVGIFGFLYIRKVSNDEFEEMFAQKNNDFMNDPSMREKVAEAAREVVNSQLDDYGKLGENINDIQIEQSKLSQEFSELAGDAYEYIERLELKVEDLETQINILANKIAQNDDPDDDDQLNSTLEQN